MPLPDLHALEIASVVIERGSVSAAASQLGLTQSAVSQALKRAEAQMEVKLIHRERRPLVPTEAGRLLLDHIKDITIRAERAFEDIRAAASQPERQDLRIGMVDTFASSVGPALTRDLIEGSLALRVSAFSGLAHSHAEALKDHEIDAAITSDPVHNREELAAYPLFREPFLLVAQEERGVLLKKRPLKELLHEHRLIRYSLRSHMGSLVEKHLQRLRIEHPHVLSFDTSDSLLAMVAGGVGIAITTPLCLMQGAVYLPQLTVVPLPGPGFTRELTFVTRRGEFDALGPRIANAARDMLAKHTIPKIAKHMPFLAADAEDMVLRPEASKDI